MIIALVWIKEPLGRLTCDIWNIVPFDEVIKEGIVGSTFVLHTLCQAQSLSYSEYTRMSNAIAKLSKESGKPPILFSLCEWGRVSIVLWFFRCLLLTWLKGRTLALGPTSWTKLEGERLNRASASANTFVLRPLAI
jgi:hypothetical protein